MSDFNLIRGRRLRATKLDGCGNVLLGPDSTVVTKGFISVTFTPNNTTADAVSVTNAGGEECVGEPAKSRFANYTVAGSFCGVMPELFSMMTGMPVVRRGEELDAVGIRINSQIDVDLTGFALEVWSTVPQGACDASGNVQYGYFLLPFIKGGTLGAVTIENGAINFTLENATTRDGNQWGVGPYDVEIDPDTDLDSPLLEALDENDHKLIIKVGVAPPDPTDGAVALGVPATGATQGAPATLTPANSYAPFDLAGLSGVTANPLTAWASGNYVRLRDGSTAYWDSDSWNAGVAP